MFKLAMDKTIIYLTDNQLDEKIAELCRRNILDSIGNYRLLSVSHRPLNFGENICVGEKVRSSLTINENMMEALKRVDTEFIAIAEHDCLYTKEHFNFIPLDKNFWYNENVWCLQVYSEDKEEFNGMFSYFKNRKANSQLIVRTDEMIRATQDRIDMMSDPVWMSRYPSGRIGEAGAMDYLHAMRLSRGSHLRHIRKKLKEYISNYQGKNWKSEIPNVDIRHNNNFTKNRRGDKRRFSIPYWGTKDDIWQMI